jgi:hypothetical protein
MRTNYEIAIVEGSNGIDPYNDNVDVEVSFPDGRRYSATFFTLENVGALMNRYRETGECRGGHSR